MNLIGRAAMKTCGYENAAETLQITFQNQQTQLQMVINVLVPVLPGISGGNIRQNRIQHIHFELEDIGTWEITF
jgi:hypothetical protein